MTSAAATTHRRRRGAKSIRGLVFVLIACVLAFADSAQAGNLYAAVAFAPRTGRSDYATGCATSARAHALARSYLGAHDTITEGARSAWVALAVSDNGGYGAGWGTTATIAKANARGSCLRLNERARILLCVSAFQ